MRRDELLDALRRAASITGDRDFVVVGSQSIHGAFNKALLPKAMTASMEVDVLPLFDTEGDKLWALSARGRSRAGTEIDGVDITTSAFPEGWTDRLVPLPCDSSPNAVIGWCLDPHDLVVAKALAGRTKDRRFIEAAIKASLVDPQVALQRMGHLDRGCHIPTDVEIEIARAYLASLSSPARLFNTARRVVPPGRRRPRREDFPRPTDMFADLRAKAARQTPTVQGGLPKGTSISRRQQGRVSRGQPTGGQFKSLGRPEGNVTLD